MDYLLVKDLEIYANHGVFQSEKELGQKFLVTLRMGYNMKKGATSNNLEDSIHYLSLIHISEPTRRTERSRMPSSA